MKIKNISTKKIVFSDLFMPGTTSNIELAPDVTVTIYDEDAEQSIGLKVMMEAGKVSKLSDEEPLDSSPSADTTTNISNALLANDKFVQFVTTSGNVSSSDPEIYTATANTVKSVRLVITDGDGTRNYNNSVSTVLMTASGGTVNGAATATITFSQGIATVSILRATAGNVDLTLSAITHPLSAEVPPVLVTAAGDGQVQFS